MLYCSAGSVDAKKNKHQDHSGHHKQKQRQVYGMQIIGGN